MATIKSFEVVLDDSQLLSPAYYENKLDKGVQVGDIIVARSGVAIGKTAIVKEEVKGIFADFTMRIRFKDYNPYFAYYYFRTSYFQYLIEINKKGLQNQNIFPSVIKEFPLIDISTEKQQRIVDKISNEIKIQDEISKKIVCLRSKIEDLILYAIN